MNFVLCSTARENMVSKNQNTGQPKDIMLKAIMKAPPFDANEAWEEVKAERRRERA